MQTKHFIYIGATIGGTIGSWIGSLMDNGNFFGLWSILIGVVGGILGIWLAYKFTSS